MATRKPKTDSIPTMLNKLAIAYKAQMEAIGGDPGDPTEVESFIGGCAIAKKIKLIILHELDDE